MSRTEFSTDLLLSLLGSGRAIEIELPEDVRAVHVAVTKGAAVVVERTTDVGARSDGESASVVVSVGAVGATLHCPLLVFLQVASSRRTAIRERYELHILGRLARALMRSEP